MPAVVTGLENLLAKPDSLLAKGKPSLGVLLNQASVDSRFRYAHTLLAKAFPGQLKTLFGPQHGMWSEQQDNMIETAHGHDPELGLPVYSLYSERRKPTLEMLEGLDFLVIDLQDVGTRVYTYIWTLQNCLEACADAGVGVVVLDRPNPIGGTVFEGPLLETGYTSFVGQAAIPMRHGLTMGEMAHFLVKHFALDVELRVVRMSGWKRKMRWPETGLPWVPPSPNLPRWEGAEMYPGQVLLEGTMLSEGRGTTTPFEVFGAPYIDPLALCEELTALDLPGVAFRPLRFEPTFQKWANESCGGLFLHVLDHEVFRPYLTTVSLLAAAKQLHPDAFAWRPPPYEYEEELMPIDILSGSTSLREAIDNGINPSAASSVCSLNTDSWREQIADLQIYS